MFISDIKLWNVLAVAGEMEIDEAELSSITETSTVQAPDGSDVSVTRSRAPNLLPADLTDEEGWKRVRFKLVDFASGMSSLSQVFARSIVNHTIVHLPSSSHRQQKCISAILQRSSLILCRSRTRSVHQGSLERRRRHLERRDDGV